MRKKYFFEIKTHFSYFNVLGIGSSLRKRQRQIIRLSKLSWKWSVGIWHHHLVQQMLKNCSLVEGWWQPTTDLPYQEKSWTRFSFCEKTHWWQTSILAGYKKHSFVFELQRQSMCDQKIKWLSVFLFSCPSSSIPTYLTT